MNDSDWNNDDVDRQSSEWLDADVEESPAVEPGSPLNERAQVRAADMQLIDALLSHMSEQAATEKENRIRQVMEVIDRDQPSLAAKRRFRGWQTAIAVAASLMVACGFLWSQFAQNTRANDVLREIGKAAGQSVDRIYHLRRDASTSNTARRFDGELYLRGRDGFVLRCGNVVLGRNGDEYWFVTNDGKVLVADNFEWMVAESERGKLELELLKELSVDSRNVPLMQLSSVAELMQHDYDVTLHSNVQRRGQRVDEIVGTLRDTASKLPANIQLWSDTDTRIIQRAELSWESDNSLVLELAPTEPIPTDWYNHEAHHSGEQPVRRVPHG